MSLPYNGNIISRAKKLRKTATLQENRLWYGFLRSYNVRFQRQKVIDSYIVDFYCHSAKLIIEIDGSQHYTEQGALDDSKRTAVFEKYNLLVLRFSNREINTSFQAVCEQIDNTVKARLYGK
ncbi:MAG: endonuclease domain-containing protein [Clostridia bacterium]|nr:endonuclease domain-containing protein [Clostridia bacterium]